ncbi:lysophospholipid acyltransferase 7 isoform X2 [Cephus cinctus]|uniref:Lysophospholipid acyltransferase 7 n=1 Tax=Cephus cinctus TaxID=211228 RepID=A0AAJ7BWK7_CEPCN|nr:lysophospholipid acyltransferase 7 isoform X2 [Cephus cinctus]
MPWDDIIYVSLLLLCIVFGHWYRQIKNRQHRQWVSTILGLTVISIASGYHAIHPIICIVVNAIIITQLSWKVCHIVSFCFTFFYLLGFFRLADWYGLPLPSAHANLIQMMLTLKLSGMAFEVNSAAQAPKDDAQGMNAEAFRKIGFMDVIHYGSTYIGILTGPYYRYRTYWDSLHRPFSDQADHLSVTCTKFKQIVPFALIHLLFNYTFPAKYALTDDFGTRSFLYRFCYIYPTFVTFRTRMYTGMALSECVCTMSGLGAYPTSCETISGLGPKNYKAIESLSKDPDKAMKEALDFETVHNINFWGVESCVLVRTAMKMWNTCVQYWMATCVYKRFPYKPLRTLFTLTLSAVWHGYHAGYYLCICSITFFLPMEDIYVKFYNQTKEGNLTKKGLGLLMWFLKSTCMAYLGISFQLLKLEETLAYYNSVYYAGQLLVVILYIVGLVLKPFILEKSKV